MRVRSCSAPIATLAAVFALQLVAAGSAQAESAGVTLELCDDVKAEDVQLALAIEYQNEDFEGTMLTVRCQGEVATLRIIGPNHPRGRIADVNLNGIEAVARSRTIAVLAAELWTAPEPNAEVVPTLRVVDTPEPPKRDRLGAKYRNGIRAGVALVQNTRNVRAARLGGSHGARGNFTAIALNIEWPIVPWFGFYTGASVSTETTMAGHAELGAPVRWRRNETGFYIPLWRKRMRVDLRYSAGTDTITAQGVYQRNSERTILPRYNHYSAGLDFAYALNTRSTLTATATTHTVLTSDDEYSTIKGARWAAAYYYQYDTNLRAQASVETVNLGGGSGDGRSYTDQSTSFSIALSYSR